MYYLLFTVYLIVCTYLVTRIPFIRKTGITPRIIAALFIIKVFAGVLIGWMVQRYYPGNDYWGLNQDGIVEYNFLMNDPHEFFTNIFRSPYKNGYSGYFNSIGSYWNDLRYNIILKMLAFCDVLSHGNYYINSLFFNFFGFFGPVALFRVFSSIYRDKKWQVIIGCFLLPSTLYFAAGIHKDLVVFTMLGLFSYALYFSVIDKFTARRSILLCLSLLITLLIRNFVAIALLAPGLAFIISVRMKMRPLISFTSIYAAGFILLIISQLLLPSFQPLKVITQKQSDFLDLPKAATELETQVLEPNLSSFIRNLPMAIDHGFLQPQVWNQNASLLLPLALELLFYEMLVIYVLIKSRLRIHFRHPFLLFAFFFAISMLLITGYIIPNTGSIVRYKSIYLPFLITPLLCFIPTNKKSTQILS